MAFYSNKNNLPFYGNRGFLPSKNHPDWYNDDGTLNRDWQELPLTEAGWLEPELKIKEAYKGNPGDFIEFYFDGISSKELGITRVSDGTRYNFDLQPTVKNVTVEVPGGDGYYFFGSNYAEKKMQIQIAFDSLSEAQMRRISNIFSPRNELKDFYFTNHPYKVWKVKITAPVQLNTLCFDEDPKHRRYKGEGTIQLQAFTPFARERMKYLDEYVEEFKYIAKKRGYNPDEAEIWVKEWEDASRLLWNKKDPEDFFDFDSSMPSQSVDEEKNPFEYSPGMIRCWNGGDYDADYYLYFARSDSETYDFRIRCRNFSTAEDYGEFRIKDLQLTSTDAGFRINSQLHLIEGVNDEGEPTGIVYNQYKTSGDYFKLPQGESWIIIDDLNGDWFRSKTLEDTYYINDPTKLKNIALKEVRQEDLLSGLKGNDFDCEYHNRYN